MLTTDIMITGGVISLIGVVRTCLDRCSWMSDTTCRCIAAKMTKCGIWAMDPSCSADSFIMYTWYHDGMTVESSKSFRNPILMMVVVVIVFNLVALPFSILHPIYATFDKDVSNATNTVAIYGGDDTGVSPVSGSNGQSKTVGDILKAKLIKDGFIVDNVSCTPTVTSKVGQSVSCSADGRIPMPFPLDIPLSASSSAQSLIARTTTKTL